MNYHFTVSFHYKTHPRIFLTEVLTSENEMDREDSKSATMLLFYILSKIESPERLFLFPLCLPICVTSRLLQNKTPFSSV